MSALMIVSTLLAVVIVAYYILQKYNPIFVFLLSGLVLLIFSFYLTGSPIPKAPIRSQIGRAHV